MAAPVAALLDKLDRRFEAGVTAPSTRSRSPVRALLRGLCLRVVADSEEDESELERRSCASQ